MDADERRRMVESGWQPTKASLLALLKRADVLEEAIALLRTARFDHRAYPVQSIRREERWNARRHTLLVAPAARPSEEAGEE